MMGLRPYTFGYGTREVCLSYGHFPVHLWSNPRGNGAYDGAFECQNRTALRLPIVLRQLPSLCALTPRPRRPAPARVLDGGRRPPERDLLELGDDLIELLASRSGPTQGGTEIGPVQ
jgi:hypothetical protein